VRLLIEKRNAIFLKAVDEYGIYQNFFPMGRDALIRLIEAFSDAEDPVALLVASAQEHIPLNTVGRTGELSHIPDPENRQPIDQIVEELCRQDWYQNQIGYRRTFEVKTGSLGRRGENTLL
jgi:DEAD/DEAH box helicase domain-containing protein